MVISSDSVFALLSDAIRLPGELLYAYTFLLLVLSLWYPEAVKTQSYLYMIHYLIRLLID